MTVSTSQSAKQSCNCGAQLPSIMICVGRTGSPSSARFIASSVACRIFSRSISSMIGLGDGHAERALADALRQALTPLAVSSCLESRRPRIGRSDRESPRRPPPGRPAGRVRLHPRPRPIRSTSPALRFLAHALKHSFRRERRTLLRATDACMASKLCQQVVAPRRILEQAASSASARARRAPPPAGTPAPAVHPASQVRQREIRQRTSRSVRTSSAVSAPNR